jgi:hypothetical protein
MINRSLPRTIQLRSRTIHQVIQPLSRHGRAQTELQIRLVVSRVNCRAASRGADQSLRDGPLLLAAFAVRQRRVNHDRTKTLHIRTG